MSRTRTHHLNVIECANSTYDTWGYVLKNSNYNNYIGLAGKKTSHLRSSTKEPPNIQNRP